MFEQTSLPSCLMFSSGCLLNGMKASVLTRVEQKKELLLIINSKLEKQVQVACRHIKHRRRLWFAFSPSTNNITTQSQAQIVSGEVKHEEIHQRQAVRMHKFRKMNANRQNRHKFVSGGDKLRKGMFK